MILLAIFVGMPLAGLGLGLGLSLGHLIAELVVNRCADFAGDDPDAVHSADQTNLVHADFRPGRYSLPQGGDAA